MQKEIKGFKNKDLDEIFDSEEDDFQENLSINS